MILFLELLELALDIYLPLFLFSKISGKKLTFLFYLALITGRFLHATFFVVFPDDLSSYFELPSYMLIVSWIVGKSYPTTLKIFYALFPITLWNLFQRSMTFFLLPMLDTSNQKINEVSIGLTVVFLLSAILTLLFLKSFQYDFKPIQSEFINNRDRKLFIFVNVSMFVYYTIIQFLSYLEYERHINTLPHRESTVVIYLILFMGTINHLDKHLREQLQDKLSFQKELQLRDMEAYSHHIEELYKGVRGFRHDYANLLTTLKIGIDQKDISLVEGVYETVLKDSDKHFRNQKYDVGRLICIQDDALKSLLAAKFIQAQENGVSLSIEIPEEITLQGMELVDFITIVSILCDNAIEASIEAAIPKMTLAYISSANKQIFVVENSTRVEKVEISKIYDFGMSSKGENKGVGLYNVLAIVNRYPNVAINTSSQNYSFRQIVEIKI